MTDISKKLEKLLKLLMLWNSKRLSNYTQNCMHNFPHHVQSEVCESHFQIEAGVEHNFEKPKSLFGTILTAVCTLHMIYVIGPEKA